MNWLWKLFGSPPPPPAAGADHLVYVRIPAPIDPEARGATYEDPLDAELRLAGLGCVSGGGTGLSDLDASGHREIEYCGVDIDTQNVGATRDLLRHHLPLLGCPAGTAIEYDHAGSYLRDIFDGNDWRLGQVAPPE
ncbi:hypothetical protein [Sphingomonas sp.]|uniref:hypothetical protein n=1 Tax=Sphingomonas sp. TaxID=28214 RepID=UPI002DD64ECB|nr:hypothetical protein [Sphingomonas sp.]